MLVLGIESRDIVFKIGTTTISPSKEVKLLGITLDDKLSFYSHIKGLCHQAFLKTKALLRIRPYVNQDIVDMLFNTFVIPCFNYCPLVWMFCSKQAHNLIGATHKSIMCKKWFVPRQLYKYTHRNRAKVDSCKKP